MRYALFVGDLRSRCRCLIWLGCVLAVLAMAQAVSFAQTYETRRDALGLLSYASDHCEGTVSALDARSFSELNLMTGQKIVDNAQGWSIEARIGGRPFICLDEISVASGPVVIDPGSFGPGTSGIPQAEIDAHLALGKTVNRLWITHESGGDYPIVVVLTPDGFLNPAAAAAPKMLGAAVRTGFIGEPFGAYDGRVEYEQHLDRLDITAVDNDVLRLVLDVHSEAGEGVIELELSWDAALAQPTIRARSARLPGQTAVLGLAGLNFMRGPTLYGRRNVCGSYLGGIEAFHDGRSVQVRQPGAAILRDLLVPPVSTLTVAREDLLADVTPGTSMLMDQPQGVSGYFSKLPAVAYEDRTDLTLRLLGTTVDQISARRAQVSVDLTDPNPEANETVNLFFATGSTALELEEHAFEVTLGDDDIEAGFSEMIRGVVFVSSGRLSFLPLDESHQPVAAARSLTDAVITDARRPAASADGRYVVFDADGYDAGTRQRIYLLDLLRGTVKRLTVDPGGSSNDYAPSLSGDGSEMSMITTRQGSPRVNVQSSTTGLSCGFGTSKVAAADADWSHAREELVYTSGASLSLLDLGDSSTSLVTTGSGVRDPAFSGDGETIAYASDSGVSVVSRAGGGETQILADGEHPTWADADSIIVHREVSGEMDLWLVNVTSGSTTRLTPADGIDCTEPAYVLRLPICTGDATLGDSDTDGICNDLDVCSGDDASGDTDLDGTCDDLDLCPGHDDAADADADAVADGCDQCAGNDITGDSDADGWCDDTDSCAGHDDAVDLDTDGVPDGCDLCIGDNATGDGDADGVCADTDCDDSSPDVAVLGPCGVCGGDGSTCAIFRDGFESGSTMAWSIAPRNRRTAGGLS